VWIYGALIGVLTVMIRYFGGLTEGVMYAILIGNALAPLIDQVTQPRVFGQTQGREGEQGMSDAVIQPATPSAAMIRTLGIVATVCGMLIVTAYQGTLEPVAANKKLALERAVFKVIPGASSVKEFVAGSGGIEPAGARCRKVR
jgi:hypothetical protein